MKGIKNHYDASFKLRAVELSYERSNISELARELGIKASLLYKWRKDYQEYGSKSFPGKGNLKLTPEQERIVELERKLKDAELERDILKKSTQHFLQERSMKYRFIKNHELQFPIEKMCIILKIHSSSYYKWRKRGYSNRLLRKKLMLDKIKYLYFKFKQRYGSPRIHSELNALGYSISVKTVAKYMQELGLRSKLNKKFRVTTNSKHNYLTVSNLLNRDFNASKPSMKWVSDITYIQAQEGFLYLTTIIDLYDRKVIGWSLSHTMSIEETTLSAWRMAIKNRPIKKGMLFHSDRGIQYASKKFTNVLDSYGVIRSMSRKGNCWDNAVAESFFKSLKTELIYGNKLITREKMKTQIFQYIEIWYNRNRRHKTLGYKTIFEFNNNLQFLKYIA